MYLTIENFLLIGSLLLLASILIGKTSYRFGVPTLIFFLLTGMLAGSEGIGKISFDNSAIAQFIGVVSLNFILFSGGLGTKWKVVKPIVKEGLILSTFGVLLTAILLGFFTYLVTDFTLYESLLLGSIVSSTDAAAVFSILRSKSVALTSNIRPTLELESGSNDPMAYVLTITFLTLVVHQDQNLISIIPFFLTEMVLGVILGIGFGFLIKYIINRIKLSYEGLYPVLMIALMFTTFSATDFLGGNGFLAIYICAVFIGNQDIVNKRVIINMYDGLAWLMQIVLFLTLGLLVVPSQLLEVWIPGILISAFLIFFARPIAVFISLKRFKMTRRVKTFISWVGLKGAVPIVFATYPLIAGIEKANTIFNIVFFISVASLLLQGTSLSRVAKWLKVDTPLSKSFDNEQIESDKNTPKAYRLELFIPSHSSVIGKKFIQLGLDEDIELGLITRNGYYIIPDDYTVFEPEDVLLVLSDERENFRRMEEMINEVIEKEE